MQYKTAGNNEKIEVAGGTFDSILEKFVHDIFQE